MSADDASRFSSADPSGLASSALISAWDRGEVPDLGELWTRFDRGRTVEVLSALVKADLRCRFRRGDRPEVNGYLDRFPALKAARDRVVSLAYEEFFLREQGGEAPDPDAFCLRYEPWRDSLAAQLRYHQAISQIVGVPSVSTKFPSPGDRFSTFRLRSVLGEGGSARVFLAMDELLGGREVALKVSADRGDEPTIQGRLDHNHIVPVLSVYTDEQTGLRGLSMPYRAGLPLDQVIRRVAPASRPKHAMALRRAVNPPSDGGPPEGEESAGWAGFPSRGSYPEGVAWVVSVVARALAYAHGKDVLHRDVKPANVLLTSRDGPQLLDFNLSHSTHLPEHAEEALRGGTLPYMAPEQLEAFCDPELWGRVAEPADIYSIGLLLREMLTGQRPDGPRQDLPLPYAIRDLLDRREAAPASVRDLNPDVPHALDAILQHCLATRPTDRYASAAALADDLRRFVDHRPLRHATNPSRPERLGNWLRRSRGTVAIATTAAILVGASAMVATRGGAATLPPVRVADRLTAAEHFERGNKSREAKDYASAREEYRRAIALEPRFFKAHWWLAVVENLESRPQACLDRYRLALQCFDRRGLPPKQEAVFFHGFAVALRGREQWGEARKMYRRALDAYDDPTMHTAYMGIAIAAGEQGDSRAALEAIEKAILLATDSRSHADAWKPDAYRSRRARIFLNEAIALQKRARYDRQGREDRLKKALDNLDQARKSEAKFDAEDQWGMKVTRAGVYIGLGDLASEVDDYRQSVPLYERAKDLLTAPLDEKREGGTVTRMRKDVEDRIEKDRKVASKKQAAPATH